MSCDTSSPPIPLFPRAGTFLRRWIGGGVSLFRTISILISDSAVRAWAVFAVIAFMPMYLIQRRYSLVLANGLVTLMLVMGVIGQVFGGVLSDRYGRNEFTILGMLLSIPAFLIFLVLPYPWRL